jgi:hypothetical protein
MHAWKHAAIAHSECLKARPEHQWLYMAAAAKVCANHSGCGHRIYDRVAEAYGPELQVNRFDWHGCGQASESLRATQKWREESGRDDYDGVEALKIQARGTQGETAGAKPATTGE